MLIDTSQIQCFLMVAKDLNFTKAANDLYLSQPVVSRKIATLEKELGITLINRTKRTVTLTTEGKKLQDFFQKYVGEFDELMRAFDEQKKSERKILKIGIFEGWDLSDFIRGIVYDFSIQYENIKYYFESGSTFQLQEGIRNGKYDALVMIKEVAQNLKNNGVIKDVIIDDLFRIQKCVLYSDKNPLSKIENLQLEDFKNQPLYCLETDNLSYSVITNQRLFEERRITPKIQMMHSVDSISTALLSGYGYAIMDDATRIFNYQGIRHVMLGEEHVISLVTTSKTKQKVELLRNYLCGRYCI